MTTLEPHQVVTLDQLPCSPAEYLQRIKAWSDAALEFDRRVAEEARGGAKRQRVQEPAAAAPAAPAAPAAAPAASAPATPSGLKSSRGNCFRCGQPGHWARECPNEPAAAASETAASSSLVPDLSRNQWVSRNKDKWTCQQAVREVFGANEHIAKALDALADEYKAASHDQWRTFAYSKAAKVIRSLRFELTDADQLKDRHGFGAKMLEKVREMLKTGHIKRLDSLQASERVQVVRALCKVHGVGQKTAEEWYSSKGIRSVDDALAAGVMTAQQQIGAKYWRDLDERIPRAEVEEIAAAVHSALRAVLEREGVPPAAVHAAAEATACGSYRRGKPSSGDVDVLICRRDRKQWTGLLMEILGELRRQGILSASLSTPGREERTDGATQTYNGIVRLPGKALHRRLDIKVYPPSEYAYALLYFTGSDHFNRSMRHYAKQRGYSLSDHGLVRAHRAGQGATKTEVRGTTNLVHAETEYEIFEALGLEYKPPTQRDCQIQVKGGANPAVLEFNGEGRGLAVVDDGESDTEARAPVDSEAEEEEDTQ